MDGKDTLGDRVVAVVAANISAHRAHLGLSFSRLAGAAGVSVSALKHLSHCRADPPLAMVLRLADAFGITLEELSERHTPPEPARAQTGVSVLQGRRYREPEEIAKAAGSRVRALRRARNMSTRQLAELADISTGMLHYVEAQAAVPSTKMLARLAAVFGLTLSAFVESLASPILSIAHGGSISDGTVSLSESRLDPGCRSDGEGTASMVMLYLVEGELWLQFEGREQRLSPGDAVLLAGGPYAMTASRCGPARFVRVTYK